MNARAVNMDGLARRLKAEIIRDKRKILVLAAALLVALFMALRLATNVPSAVKGSAIAVPSARAVGVDEGPSPEGTAPGPGGSREAARIEHIRQLDRSLKRDLFAPSPKCFPPLKRPASPARAVATTQPGADSAEARKDRIQAEAEQMTVMSTMVSSNPTAIVDGKILGIGSRHKGFEVVEINAREIVMVKEAVTVMLPLRRGALDTDE